MDEPPALAPAPTPTPDADPASSAFRSGAWWVVKRGDLGRVIRPDGRASGPMLYGSILAHVHVQDDWEPVEDPAMIPPAVAAVMDDPTTWQAPDEP